MFHKKAFREFHTDKEVCEFVMKYFNSWINDVQINNKNNISNLLYAYTGSMNVIYNRFLRGQVEFEEEQLEKYPKEIDIITKEICKLELQEDIIVYRYTCKSFFRNSFESFKSKIGRNFTEKGFMSTTLLPDLVKEFPQNHKYDYILKLYLPKGTKGAYVSIGNNNLNEYEFLLPPNATFKLLKRGFRIRGWMPMYECVLVHQ
ncbi:ADP-ribosyltransferase [Clostridium tagluense]|uniref:ADP-ribosyltransferase n=1 Tax=Clostridium tagluense TaxID=360422 RepID=UPI001CF17794|nr:ADP-ribosyltransferase [Clostridium tagluense]MCB2300670.1 ADP-ribosyltransferase [Clostridium tagluense]